MPMRYHRSSGELFSCRGLQESSVKSRKYTVPPPQTSSPNRIDASDSDTISVASENHRDAHRTRTEPLMNAAEQHGIHWERDWDAAIHRARQERRLLLIDI